MGALDPIGNLMRNVVALRALGLASAGAVPITVAAADGSQVAVEVEPSSDSWVTSEWIDADKVLDPRPEPLYRRLDGNYAFEYLEDHATLYVLFSEIRDDDGETIAEFFERVFEFVSRNDVERFVLDLRENSGGNLDLNGPVLRGLIASRKVNQPGRLFVITGRDTYSAAMNLAVSLERHTEAIFVGEPTGATPNHFGDTVELTLPHTGIRVEISELYWQNSDPRDTRPWITPDVRVDLTFVDFAAHRDPALEAILRLDPAAAIRTVGPLTTRWQRPNQLADETWPTLLTHD